MAEIKFRTAWRQQDPQLIRDASEFWRGLDVMSPEDIEERTSQLCALAYADGKVVAVSTVHLYDFPRLRSRFAYYRTMSAPDFRQPKPASRLCVYSRDGLRNGRARIRKRKSKGYSSVLEAEEFRHASTFPLTTGTTSNRAYGLHASRRSDARGMVRRCNRRVTRDA